MGSLEISQASGGLTKTGMGFPPDDTFVLLWALQRAVPTAAVYSGPHG